MSEAHVNLDDLSDGDLDLLRRDVLKEQERRQRLEEGQERVGRQVREYMEAAGKTAPDVEDADLGRMAIEAVGYQ